MGEGAVKSRDGFLLSSLRITTTSSSSSAAEGSVPQVHASAPPNENPTVGRKQIIFTQRMNLLKIVQVGFFFFFYQN